MACLPLLDTKPILRHVLDDHADHSPRAHALFARTDTVVFEAAFTLERFYKVPRADIQTVLLDLLHLPGLVLPGKRAYRQVFDLWVAQPRLSFADCYHAVLVLRRGLPAVVTFDRDFDRVPGLTRLEP